jgi:hypothetical protein
MPELEDSPVAADVQAEGDAKADAAPAASKIEEVN